jgi:N-sulfoglucosamine sulfohydrolase
VLSGELFRLASSSSPRGIAVAMPWIASAPSSRRIGGSCGTFIPKQSRLNWSSYKEDQYPGMPLLRVLNAENKLDTFQASWLAPTRPEIEFYDLKTDPQGIHNIAAGSAQKKHVEALRARLDDWIATSRDQGAAGDPATEPPLAEIQNDKRQTYQKVWQKRLQKPEPTDAERVSWWMKEYRITP